QPRLWWPNNLGSPELYTLKLAVQDQRGASQVRSISFGIREVVDYMSPEGHRGYIINGRKMLIRGGGWVDDMMLREDEKNLDAQIRYAKHLNLNTIRLEGFWGSSEKLYELADRYGMLIMAGFSCQWEWKDYLGTEDDDFGGVRTQADMDLVVQYLRDQVLWLRNHPSIFVWVLGSDKLPRPELEKRYRSELATLDPARPILASCKTWESSVSGPTGVKMNGPYDYEPPNYWYVDKENGGAFGFNTETGPGPQPPPLESIQRMFAKEHYWPIDDVWNYHCGRNEFNTLERYKLAFDRRYGEAENMEDFTKRAQAANYEAIRPMFESFGIRKPLTTGVVQWMLNASWPKMYWQLYDYYLMPGGAFYGARKANQPLHIAYDYGDSSIHIINDTYTEYRDLAAEIRVLSPESKDLYAQSVKTSIGQYESKKVLDLQAPEGVPVYFLSLKLKGQDGAVLADNFYWLSAKPDVLDFEKSDWFYTPSKDYADFSALNKLPAANIEVEEHLLANGIAVTLKNPGTQIAFFLELKAVGDRTGRPILPVFWDDNYVSLLPGETKILKAQFSAGDLRGEKPLLQVSGWNVSPTMVTQGGRSGKE
ncbi:MAG TPA: glycoside hydrolase family 2 TIM barrel-domain containing protein, partial [Acidobacteriota bacterium]|nr:glycoside hydrolase family 2 TIM barrel-domain containing protein [Acidobacteriota bacterium]